jgi:hypothetical protein
MSMMVMVVAAMFIIRQVMQHQGLGFTEKSFEPASS